MSQSESHRGRRVRRTSSGRGDIQGLRALAVVAVAADHLLDWPRGGFVGVDVFFVVSGFLITGLLVRERERTGRLSFGAFYRRRARRLMPTALLVIVVTCLASYLLLARPRASGVFVDGAWAAAFAANWRFADVGTNYFENDSTSPLQHYWSLAVEEQFYVVWPILIVAAIAVATRRVRWRTWSLPLAIAVPTGLSFLYSLWHTQDSPTVAYFSTFDRAWEFGVGALVAVLVRFGPAPAVSGLLGWSGFGVILASLFVIDGGSAFPTPWALLPVLGTAMVLASGVSSEQTHLFPLVNPVARYIGDISYSLYLWHFPVTVLLPTLVPGGGTLYVLLAVSAIAGLSVWSYHAVEDPIRRSTWLEFTGRGVPITRQVRWGWAFTVVVVAIGSVVIRVPEVSEESLQPYALSATSGRSLSSQQTAQVAAALRQTAFPADFADVAPTFGTWAEEMREDYCVDVSESNLASCRWGDGDRLAVVYGDSFAMAWVPAVVRALAGQGFRVQQLTLQQCPAWDVSVRLADGSDYPECDAFHRWALSTIRQDRPDLVITSTSYGTWSRLAGNPSDPAAVIADGLQRTADLATSIGAKLVNLSSPPGSQPLATCYSKFGNAQNCIRPLPAEWDDVWAAESSVTGVTHLDTSSWFCGAGGCPGFFGSTPIYTDGAHLDIRFATALAPLLREQLRADGTVGLTASLSRRD